MPASSMSHITSCSGIFIFLANSSILTLNSLLFILPLATQEIFENRGMAAPTIEYVQVPSSGGDELLPLLVLAAAGYYYYTTTRDPGDPNDPSPPGGGGGGNGGHRTPKPPILKVLPPPHPILKPLPPPPGIVSKPIQTHKIVGKPVGTTRIVSDPIKEGPRIVSSPVKMGPPIVSRPVGEHHGIVSHPIGLGPVIVSRPIGEPIIVSKPIEMPVITSHPIHTGKPPRKPPILKILPPPPPPYHPPILKVLPPPPPVHHPKPPPVLKILPPPPPVLKPLPPPPPVKKQPPPPPPPPKLPPPVPITGMPGQCVLNLGWITPSQANYNTPLGTQQIACFGPPGPNCTGKIAHNSALAALLPTEQACLSGQPPPGADPDGSKLAGVLLGAYGRQPVMMDGYDAIQTAPFFWYDTTSGVAAYSQNNLQNFNWKPTVKATKLSGWTLA